MEHVDDSPDTRGAPNDDRPMRGVRCISRVAACMHQNPEIARHIYIYLRLQKFPLRLTIRCTYLRLRCSSL